MQKRGLESLFLETGGLADLVAKEVQLAATHLAVTQNLDLVDLGGVHRDGALNTDTKRDLADGERLAIARPVPTDADTLKDLGALSRAFDDLVVDLDRIADVDLVEVLADLLLLKSSNDIHVPAVPLRRRIVRIPPEAGASWEYRPPADRRQCQ